MRYPPKKAIYTFGLFAGMVAALLIQTASAQFFQPFGPVDYEHDMQLFAPVELDFDNLPTGRTDGYFFVYDKTYWASTGERASVGDPNVQRESNPVYFDNAPNFQNDTPTADGPNNIFIEDGVIIRTNPSNAFPQIVGLPVLQDDIDLNGDGFADIRAGAPINPDNGLPIQRPLRQTGIRSTVPEAIFATGNRYEFGYHVDGRGWKVGIMMTDFNQSETFGFLGGSQQDSIPSGLQSPLGDVYVGFNYEQGLMHGFLDVFVGAIGTGRVLPSDTNGDGIVDGDGFADDLDGDGQFGPDGFDLEDPAYIPDSGPATLTTVAGLQVIGVSDTGNIIVIAFNPAPPDGDGLPVIIELPVQADDLPTLTYIPDYDDLVELPTSFAVLNVTNRTNVDGVELMRTHELRNRKFKKANQNNTFELSYGARYMRYDDQFVVAGNGGVLGLSFWDTTIVNNIVGPQVGFRWTNQNGRWSTNVQGRAMFGYNVSNWDQTAGIGEDLIPGRHNHPIYFQPTTSKHGRRDDDFSPLAELRMETSYRLSKSVAFKLGYTGFFVDNIRRASTHIDYTLPNMGFIDSGGDSVIVNGVNFGIEVNH